MATAPSCAFGPFPLPSAPRALLLLLLGSFSHTRSDLTTVVVAPALLLSHGQKRGGVARCPSDRVLSAGEAALLTLRSPVPNSRQTSGKNQQWRPPGSPAGHRCPQETLLAFWKPLLPPAAARTFFFPVRVSAPLSEDLERAGTQAVLRNSKVSRWTAGEAWPVADQLVTPCPGR